MPWTGGAAERRARRRFLGVRGCFDIPNLGVQLVPGGVPATTRLEGGAFIALSGGALVVRGALGDLLAAPAGMAGRLRFSDRWRGGTSVPPPHAAG